MKKNSMFNLQYYNEEGYIKLLQNILNFGIDCPDRTGVGCRKLFNQQLIMDFEHGFPTSTVRKTPIRFSFEEMWFFINGLTDTKKLEEKNIFIWQDNTTRDFLNKRGLPNEPEGSMGKAYGYQFRNFNGEDKDQLSEVVYQLIHNPFSRRHYVTFWNPVQSHEMALTPCFHSHQFVVTPDNDGNNVLNLKVFSRSCDTTFGLPFNFQEYALYQLAMAKLVGMEVGTLVIDITDAHIYHNQIEYVKEILTRDYYDPCNVSINKELLSIDDFISLKWSDIEVTNFKVNNEPFVTPRPKMAV